MNYVSTKNKYSCDKKEKNYKKNVAPQKLMLRHSKELKAKIYVVIKENYVATIKVAK